MSFSCVDGGFAGEGNIDDDPLFEDPENGELWLQAGSPCIDTGTATYAPDQDIRGIHRPQGAGFDMGAYEYAVVETGSLQVIIAPPDAVDEGAVWRVVGTEDWLASGITLPDLWIGAYAIEFKPLYGWYLPPTPVEGVPLSVVIEPGETTSVEGTYATYTRVTYEVSYSAGENGSITGNAIQLVDHGSDSDAVTAAPDTGYHFVEWSDGRTDNPRTDVNVMGPISVSASFAINIYELTYTPGAGGSLLGDTTQTVTHGFDGTPVEAVPLVSHTFAGWSDGVTDNPRKDLNVGSDLDVTALFAIKTFTLNYTAGVGGSISGVTPQIVNYDANGLIVTAVNVTGYHFTSWSDGVMTPSRQDKNITRNIDVTASFEKNTYTLTYAAGTGGTLSGATSQQVEHGASGTAVTAVAGTGYRFVNWSDGRTENPRTDTNVTGAITVTANFALRTYTLNYSAGTGGSLTGTTVQTVPHGSSGTAVTAVPNTGYSFLNWSDGKTANPRTDTVVTQNISVTANFERISYSLRYTAGSNGTLTGATAQTVYHGDSGSAVTAVPGTGYDFVGWSDGRTDNPRTDVNVTADIDVTANFALIEPEGEGEPVEGEGEVPVEGEGEVPLEGEGEVPLEGEGEVPLEGEGE
ncbi:MAG: hypothetical protein GXY07_06930, partial [Candidatus Hydrogenedentes bacterium]|nr:hypothetical protein [Candidatus Hydrogenedentota bacterium]